VNPQDKVGCLSESGLNHIAVLGAGILGGQIAWHSAYKGFYMYPNPACQDTDFLDVPDVSVVPEILKAVLHS
jgi:3-hydroxyacyl-CoA dehydrogenase